MLRPLVYLTVAVCAQLAAATLSVSQGKLSLIDSVASSASHTSTFSSESKPSPPLRDVILSSTDTIKLSFQVTDAETSQPVQPQQAVVSWQPVDEREKKEHGRQFAAVVKVRSNGKARWELDLARAPTSFLSLSKSPISLTLLLGSTKHEGLSLSLGTFQLSSNLALSFPYPPNEDLPAHWEVQKYSEQPRIDWTFKTGEKKVGTVVSVLGLGMVLAPWVVLLSVFSYLRPSLCLRSPTASQSILILSIISFEALFVVYWVKLRLIPTLPYFALLSGVVVLSGKRALGEMRSVRLEREKKEMGKTQ
ncbi:hypothetical protein JCM5350_000866 [Sporobolomyces pararoseus]